MPPLMVTFEVVSSAGTGRRTRVACGHTALRTNSANRALSPFFFQDIGRILESPAPASVPGPSGDNDPCARPLERQRVCCDGDRRCPFCTESTVFPAKVESTRRVIDLESNWVRRTGSLRRGRPLGGRLTRRRPRPRRRGTRTRPAPRRFDARRRAPRWRRAPDDPLVANSSAAARAAASAAVSARAVSRAAPPNRAIPDEQARRQHDHRDHRDHDAAAFAPHFSTCITASPRSVRSGQ